MTIRRLALRTSNSHLHIGQSINISRDIQEFGTAADLEGDKNLADFAAALDVGYRADGWPDALRKGIEVSLAQRAAT